MPDKHSQPELMLSCGNFPGQRVTGTTAAVLVFHKLPEGAPC
jgi:hypothetical protein